MLINLCTRQMFSDFCFASLFWRAGSPLWYVLNFIQPQVTKAYVTQVTMQAWLKSLYGVKIKSKFRQQYSLKNPQKSKLKSEKACPVCFAVFSMLFSAYKRCFERFISQQLVHVHHCIMLMEGRKLQVEFQWNLAHHLRRALRKPR